MCTNICEQDNTWNHQGLHPPYEHCIKSNPTGNQIFKFNSESVPKKKSIGYQPVNNRPHHDQVS